MLNFWRIDRHIVFQCKQVAQYIYDTNKITNTMMHSSSLKASISRHFIKPQISPPLSQESATCPCPKPDQSSPPILVLKIHINIILPSTPISSKSSLYPRFLHKNPACTFSFLHMCYTPYKYNNVCVCWNITQEVY